MAKAGLYAPTSSLYETDVVSPEEMAAAREQSAAASDANAVPELVSPGELGANLITTDAAKGKAGYVTVRKGDSAYAVHESELERAIGRGYAPETPEQSAVRSYLEENRGASGALKVAAESFLNEASFGVADAMANHFGGGDALDAAKAEALRKEHWAANLLGGIGGFGTSFLYGGELFKGAEMLGRGAEGLVTGGRLLAGGALAGEEVAAKALGAQEAVAA